MDTGTNSSIGVSNLKWHLTKWVPKVDIEDEIKLDINIFYVFIIFLVLIFLFILRAIMVIAIYSKKVGFILNVVLRSAVIP